MAKDKSKNQNDNFEATLARARELQGSDLDWIQAFGKAWQEDKIRRWPQSWGDDLHVLIYGDFHEPPKKVLEFQDLGITILPEKKEKTVIRNALCVLEARVDVKEKSQDALLDAVRRLNVLLGAWTLVQWGNGHIGWWSWITHEGGGGTLTVLEKEGVGAAVTSILKLPNKIHRKIDAALYWIRASRNMVLESYKNDLIAVYAAYWNSFECLVDAVCELRPETKMSRTQKETAISQYFRGIEGKITCTDIEKCYQQIVNPGFVGKACHTLRVCFGEQGGSHYEYECFRRKPKKQRLYDIRNAINHGEFDAENIDELLMLQSRFHKLFLIIWGIFGRLVNFSFPLDRDIDVGKKNKSETANESSTN